MRGNRLAYAALRVLYYIVEVLQFLPPGVGTGLLEDSQF